MTRKPDIDLSLFNAQGQTLGVFVQFIPFMEQKISEEVRLKSASTCR